jgi:hypothetical protein
MPQKINKKGYAMMNAKKKTVAKWIVRLSVVMLMGIANTAVYGMEQQLGPIKEGPIKELEMRLNALPPEVRQHILSFSAAIIFLSQQPITLAGHAGTINSVAVGDGVVVTGSDDNTAKIWDIQSGALLRTLTGHTGVINSVAVGNGVVVTGSWDNTAKIWDIQSGTLLHTLAGHTDVINSVAVGNGVVVTGSWDNTAKIWDIQSGTLLHTLAGHTGAINSVAVGNGVVVTGSWDNTAKIWDIQSGALLHTLAGHTGAISSVAVGDGVVVTGSGDNTAKIWLLKPFAGTSQTNPLLWIIDNATMPELHLINRAYEATIIGETLMLDSKDLQIFNGLPMPVKRYLLDRLRIRLNKKS